MLKQHFLGASLRTLILFSEHCFRKTHTARQKQIKRKDFPVRIADIIAFSCDDSYTGARGGQANIYAWSELLKRHLIIFLIFLWDNGLWICVSEAVCL